mgnify:CR=1 FL=1
MPVKVAKRKPKEWYVVYAPPYLGNIPLEEIPASDPKTVIGRTYEATLFDITQDIKYHYIHVYFKCIELEDKKVKTMFKGHEIARDYLRSLTRRNTSKVDAIVDVETKDGYRLRVSATMFTVHRISTSRKSAMRKIAMAILQQKASELRFEEFVQQMLFGKLASDIYNQAKKIAPLRKVEIRKSKLLQVPVAAS